MGFIVQTQHELFQTLNVISSAAYGKHRIYITSDEQISLLVIRWLADKFAHEDFYSNKDLYQYFKHDSKATFNSQDLQKYVLEILHKFKDMSVDASFSIDDINSALYSDIIGSLFQKGIDLDQRKKLASNYTLNHIADYIASRYTIEEAIRIIDPFCGSGRLITSLIDFRSEHDLPIKSVRINDIMPTAVLIAAARIYQRLVENGIDIDLDITIGDAFQVFAKGAIYGLPDEKYDLVVMNPPFTRTHRLDKVQRKNLQWLLYYYEEFVNGQAGLHIHSIFLADYLLKKGGHLGAVLPASTILSDYSRGVQKFFLKTYGNIEFSLLQNANALSEGSEIREILFFGKKGKETPYVRFNRLREDYSVTHIRVKATDLLNEWNWYKFLNMKELVKLYNKIVETGFIKSADDLKLNLIRGLEMYGPNFFFFPNKDWQIYEQKDDAISIIDINKNKIEIPRKYLVKSLRKPGLYSKYITPEIEEYALSIPSEFEGDWFDDYLKLNNENARVSQRNFGDDWYSHIYHQIQVKKPYGYTFIIDKMGILTTSVGSHFLDEKTVCTKNFYVLKDLDYTRSKFVSAWMNSSLFLVIFLTSRREISGSFGRLQISDYKRDPTIIDLKLSRKNKDILDVFDEIRTQKLPPWRNKKSLELRQELDMMFAQLIGLDDKIVKNIHKALLNVFKELSIRDKK